MNNCNANCENGILEILQVINVLQTNACPEGCLLSCDRPALGGGTNCVICNTRPIMIYGCGSNGTPWSMPISRDTTIDTTSNIFRVEKVDNNCVTFRVLVPNTDTTSIYPYTSTDSLFTISIDCICAIRCLNDTYIECV